MAVKKTIGISEQYIWLLIILGLSLAARLWLYRPQVLLSDASAYILMGKYIFSSGQAGLIEPLRPLAWPLMLGFAGWVGLDPVFLGSVLNISFSLGSITLVYLIACELFDAKAGLLAAMFLALSPANFFWGNCLCSEVPACFFGLLAFYLYVREHDGWAGALVVFSFFVNFIQIIVVAFVGLGLLFEVTRFKKYRRYVWFLTGGAAVTLVFLLFQWSLYADPFYPFVHGKAIYNQVSYNWYEGFIRAAFDVLKVEHAALTLAPLGIWYVLRGRGRMEVIVLALIALCFFIWIGKFSTSSVRYAILVLPYAYIFSAVGFLRMFQSVNDRDIVFRIWLAFMIMSAFPLYKIITVKFSTDKPDAFQSFAMNNEGALKSKRIWVSSPRELVLTNLKADQMMYYPVFNAKRARDLRASLSGADVLFLDTGNLVCVPADDSACLPAKARLIGDIENNFKAVQYNKDGHGEIRAIYERKK